VRKGRDRAWLLLATAAATYVAAAWLSKPGFYDGFAPPADTYRWVKPPAGVTPNGEKPLPGHLALPVSGDHSRVAGGTLATGEKPPQAAVAIPAGALQAPNLDSVELDLTPEAAPGRPAEAVIVGNLYCLTSSVSLIQGQKLQLTLRYSDQLPGANAVYRYDDEKQSWVELPASRNASAATVTSAITALGCYAPAGHLAGSTQPPAQAGSGNRQLPYLAAGAIALVLLASLPLYLRARRKARAGDRSRV